MQKTVDKNSRDTVVELDGGECEVVFSAKYSAFALMNNGAADVVMSIEKGKTEADDGVRIVGSGESAIIAAPMLSDKVYVTGAGRVQIAALMGLTNPFKAAAKGGGEPNKINSISVNGTILTPDENKKVEVTVPTKTSELTNDAKFQTETEVQNAIGAKIGGVYTPKGTVAFADLPALTAANVGGVYNISNAFVTTADFVEGAGVSHSAGANIAIVEPSEGVYKYDVLAGSVDLSNYYNKTETDNAISAHNSDENSHADIRALALNSVQKGEVYTKAETDSKLSGKANSSHTHKYAGSSSAGGAATTALACTGNAATATTLKTGRTIQVNLASTSAPTFNGSANITPGVKGVLPVANGGTGNTTGDAKTLGGKAASAFATSTHTHDDRYYTETEIDSKLSGKADTSSVANAVTAATPNTFSVSTSAWVTLSTAVAGRTYYANITASGVTAADIPDVYFNAASLEAAEKAGVIADTASGYVKLYAKIKPASTLAGTYFIKKG